MDEPFGAVDPIARDRLQEEFLRLHAELGKTVVFVTHDIEEAVRLGDRIAVMREGGHLEQYDTPATILGNPATPFVADFVGADRGLKRLAVTGIDPADLDHPPVVQLDDTASAARRRAVRGRRPLGRRPRRRGPAARVGRQGPARRRQRRGRPPYGGWRRGCRWTAR